MEEFSEDDDIGERKILEGSECLKTSGRTSAVVDGLMLSTRTVFVFEFAGLMVAEAFFGCWRRRVTACLDSRKK